MKLYAKNELDMENLGQALGALLVKGDVVALMGDLGAGKTTLTKAIGHKLQVPGYMTSPSYNIVNAYECPKGPVYHADVYRIDDVDALDEIGFFEYLHENGFVLIEWANKIYEDLKEETDQLITIRISHADVGRAVEVDGYNGFNERLKELKYETTRN